MRVKDLIKELQACDPEGVVNGVYHVEELRDYYDGSSIEIGSFIGVGEVRSVTYRRGTKIPKVVFYEYSTADYFFDCGYENLTFDDTVDRYKAASDVDSFASFERQLPALRERHQEGADCRKEMDLKFPDKDKS